MASKELTLRARTLHTLILVELAITNSSFLMLAITQPGLRERLLAYSLSTIVPAAVLLALNRRGYTWLASVLLVVSWLSLVTLGSLRAGGVRSPGVGLYFMFVWISGLSRTTVADPTVAGGTELPSGTYVCIVVRDTGVGMTNDVHCKPSRRIRVRMTQ